MRLGDEIVIEQEGFTQDAKLTFSYCDLLWKAFEEYCSENWQAGQEEFGFDQELDTFHPHSDQFGASVESEIW